MIDAVLYECRIEFQGNIYLLSANGERVGKVRILRVDTVAEYITTVFEYHLLGDILFSRETAEPVEVVPLSDRCIASDLQWMCATGCVRWS